VQVAFDVDVALAIGILVGLVAAHFVPAATTCSAKAEPEEEHGADGPTLPPRPPQSRMWEMMSSANSLHFRSVAPSISRWKS
jgi:hypothetical protein